MKCEVCHESGDLKIIAEYKEYKLYHCPHCDVMFWNPMKSLAGENYDQDGIAETLSALSLRKDSWAHKQFLKQLLLKSSHLLEIGCSTGEFLDKAKEAGYSVTGIDSSPKNAAFARLKFGIQEIYPLSIKDFIANKPAEKYDVIVMFQVLEHLDDVSDFMESIKVLLKPNGILASSVPNNKRWRFSSEKFFREKWDLPPIHLSRWNKQSLQTLFLRHDFTIMSSDVEPFKINEHSWNNFVTEKLGIHFLAEKIAASIHNNMDLTPEHALQRSTIRKTIVKCAGYLYIKIFYPFLAILTLPLRILFRKEGNTIYVVATRKN